MNTCIFCGMPTSEQSGNHYQSTECLAARIAECNRLEAENKNLRDRIESLERLLEATDQLNNLVWGEQ